MPSCMGLVGNFEGSGDLLRNLLRSQAEVFLQLTQLGDQCLAHSSQVGVQGSTTSCGNSGQEGEHHHEAVCLGNQEGSVGLYRWD